jgi:hypothetical protein
VSIPDVCQFPKAIVLQFENEIGMVEWLTDKAKLGVVHSRREHMNRMRSERGGDKRRKGESRATGTLVVWENRPGPFIIIRSGLLLGADQAKFISTQRITYAQRSPNGIEC